MCDVEVADKVCTSSYDYDFGTVVLTSFICHLLNGTPHLTEHHEMRWVALPKYPHFGLGARRPGNSAIAFHNESRQKIASTNTMDGHYDSSLIDALLSSFILSVVRTIA